MLGHGTDLGRVGAAWSEQLHARARDGGRGKERGSGDTEKHIGTKCYIMYKININSKHKIFYKFLNYPQFVLYLSSFNMNLFVCLFHSFSVHSVSV